jgi:hypothetical protein
MYKRGNLVRVFVIAVVVLLAVTGCGPGDETAAQHRSSPSSAKTRRGGGRRLVLVARAAGRASSEPSEQ